MPVLETSGAHRPRRAAILGGVAIIAAGLAILAVVLDLGPFDDGGSLSRSEFIARGDEICRQAQGDFTDVQKTTPETTAPQAAVLTGKLIDISEGEFNSINKLQAPADMRADVDAYLKSREKGIQQLKDAYEAAQKDDFQAYNRAKIELARGQAHRTQLAKAVGFHDCSQQFLTPGAEPTTPGAG
jgi:hypothetical protein